MKLPQLPKSVRYVLLSLRDLITSASPFVIAAAGLLWLAYWWLDPMPPKKITLATGPAQSAYAEFGQRYAKALQASGIEVELLTTDGSSANLELLHSGQADAGFVQGGTTSPQAQAEDAEVLVTLGNLFVEPIWLFYRSASAQAVTPSGQLSSLTQLAHMRVNVGAAGSGVPTLMQTLLDMNRVAPKSITLSQLDQTPATVKLLQGQLDAVVFASAPEAPIVQMLLQTPGIRLMDFHQNEAYARRLPFVTPATLPNGIVDLARKLPTQDVHLIATTTSMLARDDVHPALRQLLSQAAMQIHGQAGWFNRAREFPNAGNAEYPLAPEAERTMRTGVPSLQRYIPFTLANLIERMWLALGLIIAVLLPLGKIAPPLYAFRVRSRVFRWYGQLREIEERLEESPGSAPELLTELNALESKVEKIIVPLSYTDELYTLRNHIGLVRQRLLTA
ncbi:TAXI family TRAP transporter solute-binding subunit [Rhodoferax sp. TS-BS-61-7]|uniref:TAXI family TRAP transporter solute-binding subunit n=1 Tax=Rhodoferax sp. TS-BS-61-7 TaxID=2094194 RepID=UPI00191C3155|nr:TAXI family TRAP transporter solute-binding subunit [Rhodoferax sp. TS-BS-61-7]